MVELAILDDDGDVIARKRCEGDRHFEFTYAGVRGTITVIDEDRSCPNCEAVQAENEALRQRVETAAGRLRKITNPIAWFQSEAEKSGSRLDGMTAHRISEDPHWLKQQAQQALAALAPQEGE